MKASAEVRFAVLPGEDGSRVELGWKPRDARQRFGSPAGCDNWLGVHGRVSCAEGRWEFADASLTETEAAELADFLERGAGPAGERLVFIEPCLSFALRAPSGESPVVAIRFRAEVSPPWIRHDPDLLWGEGFTLTMPVAPPHLARFAREIRSMVTRND